MPRKDNTSTAPHAAEHMKARNEMATVAKPYVYFPEDVGDADRILVAEALRAASRDPRYAPLARVASARLTLTHP